MNMFDGLFEEFLNSKSDWIQIIDPNSQWIIDDFPYDTGVDEEITKPHCWRCVTVNKCWFKNEVNKKPLHFNYENYSYGKIPLSKRGLYHPNCECKEISINVPRIDQIIIMKLREKFNDFFKRKRKILYSIGYSYKDEKEIIENLENQYRFQYRYGNYSLYKHWKFGYEINIIIKIKGKNEFKNTEYCFKSGFIVFPKGKLRLVTIFAGRA